MSGQALPVWLTEALSAPEPCERQASAQESDEILPGDIWLVSLSAKSDAGRRLFLVIDTKDGWFNGMLVSAETEMATEVDAVLSPEQTEMGYRVVAHSRFHGPLWNTQVVRRVGAVESNVLYDIERLAWNGEADVDLPVGIPLQPKEIDPRYPALEVLSAELNEFTLHCRRHPDLDSDPREGPPPNARQTSNGSRERERGNVDVGRPGQRVR